MKLIVGLGNIGEEYCFTRHNVGFMAVDKIAFENNTEFKEDKKLKAFITKFKFNNEDIMLAKPTTLMNASGVAVRSIAEYYKIRHKDILIIFDDINLDLGTLRFRGNGSDGGHNGIKSVIRHLGTQNIDRLKVGIGPQPSIPSEKFVLQKFSKEQLDLLKELLPKIKDSVECYLTEGLEKAQNKFN